jgi:hypothetical protein
MEEIGSGNVNIKSKRGRKKKWENTNFKNYTTNPCDYLNFVLLKKEIFENFKHTLRGWYQIQKQR